MGRSHLINWKFQRLHHLLSDHEKVVFGFLTMLPNLIDLREQYPLPIESGVCVRANPLISGQPCMGTVEIAEELRLRHPVVRKDGIKEQWVMSTDYLIDLQAPGDLIDFLAISVKFEDELTDPRKLELLRIEREYWRRQGIVWLLLTPQLYDRSIVAGILAGMSWATDNASVNPSMIEQCALLQHHLTGMTLSQIESVLIAHLRVDQGEAKRIFWQAIWSGRVHINLARCMRPNAMLEFLSEDAFWRQNPIASRRTAWKM